MRRVSVVGTSSGVGKTTLARRLSERLGVPFIELDALFWRPNWTKAPTEGFRAQVIEAIRGDGWVADGNYTGRLGDLIWQRADTVVWLDLPLGVSLWRTVVRTVRRTRINQELWSGNRENVWSALLGRESLLVYAMRSHTRRRRLFEERSASARYPHLSIHRLRSTQEVEAWIRTTA